MKTTKKIKGIMKCSKSELLSICITALNRIDNYQQKAADKHANNTNIYVNAFNEIEKIKFTLKDNGNVSYKLRNNLRILIKGIEKKASIEFN